MNVLIFVMSMLMLLAIMTYGRLETFRNFALTQAQFKTYMEKTERNYLNEEAVKRYKSTVATPQEKATQSEQQNNAASSLLSFNLFIDQQQRLAHPEELESHFNLTRNLMTYLYGDQPFFLEIEEKRPDFLNEILLSLIRVTENRTEKLKNKKELATLDLESDELNEVFTKILRGTVDRKEPLDTVDRLENVYKPNEGYYSLLEFITIKTNKLKTRVFLASPQLLMAIYGNPETVRQILETRYALYKEYVNNRISLEEGNQEFQSSFENMQLPNIPPNMLDYGISKTNPRSP